MLVLDQLRRGDKQLRLLALFVCLGMLTLLAGLWWVQVVRGRDFRSSFETQSCRTVRMPAVRGRILDRNGNVLAESRPTCNISIYLEELSPLFRKEYRAIRPMMQVTNSLPFWKRWVGISPVTRKRVRLTQEQDSQLQWEARYRVVERIIADLSAKLQQPLSLNRTNFQNHYQTSRALPFPVIEGATTKQIVRFEEAAAGVLATDLEVRSTRVYPLGETAAHVMGYVRSDPDPRSMAGEDASFSYRLPDYRGQVGIERGFDAELRGRAGTKSVLVNSLGYRQGEYTWSAALSGSSVILTLDLEIQQATERAMRRGLGPHGRGAAVVMDATDGDVLAMVSLPMINPGTFIQESISRADWDRLMDPYFRPQINRATQENYLPGSVFKPIVGLACLERGLDPGEQYRVEPYRGRPEKGVYHLSNGRMIMDQAEPGLYNFRLALIKSSNAYFVHYGVLAGIGHIAELVNRLHLGERCDLPTFQETGGDFPTAEQISHGWSEGDTANICIGQGAIAVTPLQMAVMTSAIANGGKVFWPRLVQRVEATGPNADTGEDISAGRLRDQLSVKPQNLKIIRDAMLADVEDAVGTGRAAFINGFRICGKTGTAQRTDLHSRSMGVTHNLWFISFAPYENPRYAVVVVVESGGEGSGGSVCAPIAHAIYEGILKAESRPSSNLARR